MRDATIGQQAVRGGRGTWGRARPAPFGARLLPGFTSEARDFAEAVAGAGHATVFQAPERLRLWYERLAGAGEALARPVVVMVHDTDGNPVMLLPLCMIRAGGLSLITFADLGMSDYNAPLARPGFLAARLGMRALWRAVRQALPPADALLLEKMPPRAGGRPNPLLHLPLLTRDPHDGHLLRASESWEDTWNALKPKFRKDQQRRWRRLHEAAGDSLRITRVSASGIDTALDIAMAQKHANLRARGLASAFDDPARARFLRDDMRSAVRQERGLLFSMHAGDRLLASVFGHVQHGEGGHAWLMTFATHAPEREWARHAPGRLLTEHAMRALHAEGFRLFDFTIGSEGYKFDFGARPTPLWRLALPLSPRGLPLVAAEGMRAFVRRHPALRQLLARLAPR